MPLDMCSNDCGNVTLHESGVCSVCRSIEVRNHLAAIKDRTEAIVGIASCPPGFFNDGDDLFDNAIIKDLLAKGILEYRERNGQQRLFKK